MEAWRRRQRKAVSMKLSDIEEFLKTVSSGLFEKLKDKKHLLEQYLIKEKKAAIELGNEEQSNYVWCIERVLEIYNTYLEAFQLLKEEKFYDAWVLLEQLELEIDFLTPHFGSKMTEYKIEKISRIVKQYQSLYPYKIFFSPEILEIQKRCNICNGIVSIRTPCGHEVGQLYNGEMCIRIIEDAKMLGISVVEEPVQKYSVPFLVDPDTNQRVDQYDYSLVKWVVERLQFPFDNWQTKWSKIRHPHTFFKDRKSGDACPCGSKKSYYLCCLRKKGVLRPHCDFFFENPDPDKPLSLEFHY
ncbi:hypothetical protein V6Z05_00490 [Leptospira venezuelensis]|uniref:hypothetical protein n=1 Tax=Leptospira venezuelensis TaxID=1958811 RepID=UPI001319CEB5|nr:hypothetical protein [Leptospira venezuelensis]